MYVSQPFKDFGYDDPIWLRKVAFYAWLGGLIWMIWKQKNPNDINKGQRWWSQGLFGAFSKRSMIHVGHQITIIYSYIYTYIYDICIHTYTEKRSWITSDFLDQAGIFLENFHITTSKHAWSTTMGTGTGYCLTSWLYVIDLTEQQQVMFTDVDKERQGTPFEK